MIVVWLVMFGKQVAIGVLDGKTKGSSEPEPMQHEVLVDHTIGQSMVATSIMVVVRRP
jgi:hypothetical protein